MAYYKLVIAYDGFDYHGWQVQPGVPTICGELKRTFEKVFNQKPLWLTGASRTDAGVHAWGQVAVVKTGFVIDGHDLKRAWQAHLPSAIMLRDVFEVDDQFHPQRKVRGKIYEYAVATQQVEPFMMRYCLVYTPPFDVELLKKYLQVFVGTHDFRSFCTGTEVEDTVRRVDSIDVLYDDRTMMYTIRVQGPGFLRYMIRRIVGASLQLVSQTLRNEYTDGVEHIKHALAQKSPAQQLWTAPGHGLILRAVHYDDI